MKRTFGAAALGLGLLAAAAQAQDMMRDVDLSSPDMVSAEMTRAEVEAALATATVAALADFTGKRLSGLDISRLTCPARSFARHGSTRRSLSARSSILPLCAPKTLSELMT
jgi:hypothetical protein